MEIKPFHSRGLEFPTKMPRSEVTVENYVTQNVTRRRLEGRKETNKRGDPQFHTGRETYDKEALFVAPPQLHKTPLVFRKCNLKPA